MTRIIIENRSHVADAEVVGLVSLIINEGRVSNEGEQYAYGTRCGGNGYPTVLIWSYKNKKSDRFVAVDERT